MHRMRRSDDSGFTLLEVMTTCLLLGVLVAIAVGPWRSFMGARAQRDGARELVSMLRHAQISSTSEVATYRVDLTATTAKEYRITPSSGTAVLKNTLTISEPTVSYQAASFADSAGVLGAQVFFYPKGAASPGTVEVRRANHSKVYTVVVEGLTARVSING